MTISCNTSNIARHDRLHIITNKDYSNLSITSNQGHLTVQVRLMQAGEEHIFSSYSVIQ